MAVAEVTVAASGGGVVDEGPTRELRGAIRGGPEHEPVDVEPDVATPARLDHRGARGGAPGMAGRS